MELRQSDSYLLVKAALESKAITLSGPTSNSDTKAAGKADAEYLVALIEGLMAKTAP